MDRHARTHEDCFAHGFSNGSKHRLFLLRDELGWMIMDLGSSSGFYVNHRRAEIAVLREGDELSFASYRLRWTTRPTEGEPG